jgi:S-ribosylhomocysteine lyase LuxS involved in autoinducer biosynthesis
MQFNIFFWAQSALKNEIAQVFTDISNRAIKRENNRHVSGLAAFLCEVDVMMSLPIAKEISRETSRCHVQATSEPQQ